MTFRVRAYVRFFVRIAGNPLIPASRTMEHHNFFLRFIHTLNILQIIYVVKYLIKDILLKVLIPPCPHPSFALSSYKII
jgi:hypothetical protein